MCYNICNVVDINRYGIEIKGVLLMEKQTYSAYKKTWTVNSLIKRWKNNEINFDNPIQRGFVWNKKDSSLYIHSLLYNILIYQKPFLISKKETGFDILDGKQRGTTLIRFVNNEFALSGLEKEPKIYYKGEEIVLKGKRFKQLPEEFQMNIMDFEIDIAMLENAPAEIEALFFERSNSGRAMSKIDMSRSRNKDIESVKELSKHELFTVMFTKNRLDKLAPEEIIVKTWQCFNENTPDFSSKHYTEVTENLVLTDEDKEQIINAYDMILGAYKIVNMHSPILTTLMLRKIHLLSYIGFIDYFADSKALADWIIKFYSSMPEIYQTASSQQTTSHRHVLDRQECINQSIEEFLNRNK